MKRHVSKAEVKARLARRAERQAGQLGMDQRKRKDAAGRRTLPSLFGRPYRDRKAARAVSAAGNSRRGAIDGSRLARMNRAHDARILRDGADLHWEKALERKR